jgi:hypothetical protein
MAGAASRRADAAATSVTLIPFIFFLLVVITACVFTASQINAELRFPFCHSISTLHAKFFLILYHHIFQRVTVY